MAFKSVSLVLLLVLGMNSSLFASDDYVPSTGLIAGAAVIGGLYLANKLYNQPVKANIELQNCNIMTFDPGEQCNAADYEKLGYGATCEQGIKGILERMRKGEEINTYIRMPNVQLKKERSVHVFSGVPKNKKVIFIYSGGWIVGACGQTKRSDGHTKDNNIIAGSGVGVHLVNRYMRFGLLNGTTIAFDYPTDARRSFSAGQLDDVICLKKIYDEVVLHNPQAQIVLVGDCKGATTIVNMISHPDYYNKLPQVKGILIESPPASLKHVAYNIADRWIWLVPGSRYVVHGLFQLAMPAYDASDKVHTLLNAQKAHLPADLPIFIGRIQNDDIANDMMIQEMVDKLKENGNKKVYLYTTSDLEIDPQSHQASRLLHGRLGKVVDYQRSANAFFDKYGFDCEPILAKDGKNLLAQALQK